MIKGEGHVITWIAEGDLLSNPISLYYSSNGGDSWITIIENISNDGYCNWTVPNINTSIALIKVTCRDIYGNIASDVSDMTFAIDPPPFYGISDTNEKTNFNKNNAINNNWILIMVGFGAIIAGITLVYYMKRREEE